jgi:hypothetical protein
MAQEYDRSQTEADPEADVSQTQLMGLFEALAKREPLHAARLLRIYLAELALECPAPTAT